MRQMRLIRLVVRLARVLDARPAPQASDARPIDPAWLPLDLAARRWR